MRTPLLGLAALLALALPAEAGLDPDRLAGLRARNIGPAGMSGRVTAVEGLARDPDTVYVGAASGGLWRTRNAGVTWEPLFDDQPVHAIGAIAVSEADADIVWVGTGEGNVRNSVSVGNGVYLSRDAGRTWKHVGLEKSERIHRIRLSARNPEEAWVCAMGPEWGEGTERGLFHTTDAGKTWKRRLFVDEKTGCADVVLDPRNPSRLLVSTWEFRRWPHFFKSGGPGSGLFLSHDGGETWRRLQEEDGLPKGELGRIGLASAPSNPDVVYAIVEAAASALLRSEDGGRTWTKVNEKPSVAPRPFYFNELRVDPADEDRVYSVDYVVKVSADAGRTFKVLPGAAAANIHVDHHALWIAPRDPGFMVLGNDGGVAVSHDGGRTARFVENLPLAQYYHVAVDDEQPYNVYGGLQDNGSWRGPNTAWRQGGIRNHDWLEVGGGDGFETLPNPKDSTQGYSLSQGGFVYRWNLKTGEQKVQKPAPPDADTKLRFNWNAALATDPFDADVVYVGSQFVHRSRDRGDSWEIVSPDLTSNNPEWQKAHTSGGLTIDVTAAENHTTLVSIAPSPLQRGLIWTGSDDGRVHLTRDGGATWTSVEAGLKGLPPHTWIPHVEPGRHDAGTAFLVADNHRRNDWTPYVYRTDDFGKTWRSLVTPEIRGYALVVRQDPVDRDLLFLGTEFGLYFSGDGGRSWSHLKRTIPTASVHDLVIHPREHDLVIATHGRAIWILDDVRPLRDLDARTLSTPLRLYPVADAQQHWKAGEAGGFGFGDAEFRGSSEPYGALLTYTLDLPGLPLQDDEKERERRQKERDARRAASQPSAAASAVAKRQVETSPAAPVVPTEALPADAGKDEAKDEDKPQVRIQVSDASGRLIRSFKAPARLGVNRASWDLRRDAFRQAPTDPDSPFATPEEEDPAGPEVPPGSYTVKVSYGGYEASQVVLVKADPRSANTAADWQRRWDAILRAGELNDRAVAAIWKVRRTRDDVGSIQEKARQAAADAGERDKKKLAELPLVKAGDQLKKGLGELEKRLWQAPEVPGIQPDTDVLTRIGYPDYTIRSSWDPPSPNHLRHLAAGEAELTAFLKDLDAFFEREVEVFRKQAAEAGLGLLAAR